MNYVQLTSVLLESLQEHGGELEALKADATAAKAQAAQATATTDAFEARLRALETGGAAYPVGQARK